MGKLLTILLILISALVTSCSSILISNENSADSYKVLTFNPFVLRDYNVVVAETIYGEAVLILVKLNPPQKYNKVDFDIIKINKKYKLDLISFSDSVKFDGIPIPLGSHLDGNFMDVGRFEHNGKIVDYYDVRTKYLLLPHYFTSDMCANNRTIILVKKKNH